MTTPQLPPATALAGKYLSLTLDRESYAIAVQKVREIIRLQKITPVPQMPAHIKGVINLRGRVIPVVDLRTKFGLAALVGERTCIVVVEVASSDGRPTSIGLIIDSVDEVLSIAAGDIEPPPELGHTIETHYLLGLAKSKNSVKLLLDIDRVVAPEELAAAA